MGKFNDAEGDLWDVVIDVAAIKRVRKELGVDLYKLIDDGGKGFEALLGDVVQLIDVLYVLCDEQCGQKEIDDEAFGRRFHGESIEQAGRAFMEAYLLFCPNRRAAAGLEKLMTMSQASLDRVLTKAEARLDKIKPEELDKLIDSMVERSNSSSGTSPARSESTRGPEPSES